MQSLLDHLLWPLWKLAATRSRSIKVSEEILGSFAPLSLILLFLARLFLLVVGYALMMYGFRQEMHPTLHNFSNAVYLAGSSLCNMGLGDYLPVSNVARGIVLMTGFSGLLVFALVISLLFALHSFVHQREVLINLLVARTDGLTSGLSFLTNHARRGLTNELNNHFGDWEIWAAEVLESHSTYPVLGYFRSSIRGISWVGAIGAVLDAATLFLSCIEGLPTGAAQLFYSVGCRATRELAKIYGLSPIETESVNRQDFDNALSELARVGYKVKESDPSWNVFLELRSGYVKNLRALAHYFSIPATAWVYEQS